MLCAQMCECMCIHTAQISLIFHADWSHKLGNCLDFISLTKYHFLKEIKKKKSKISPRGLGFFFSCSFWWRRKGHPKFINFLYGEVFAKIHEGRKQSDVHYSCQSQINNCWENESLKTSTTKKLSLSHCSCPISDVPSQNLSIFSAGH